MHTIEKRTYTTKMVAMASNRCPSTIRRLCIDYHIGVKVGRDRLFSKNDINEIKAIFERRENPE